jgi:phytol kinase
MTIRGRKSVEGSAAFFLVAFPCVLVPLLLFTSTDRVGIVLISSLIGLLVMLVEAVSWEGLDNLLIPLCGCFLLAVLLPLNTVFLLIGLVVILCLLVVTYRLSSLRVAAIGKGVQQC